MEDKWKGRALGAILLDSQLIKADDVERALTEQKRSGKRFGEALVDLGIVTIEDVHWGLSHQLDVPFVRIRRELIDDEAVREVPEAVARRHIVLPYLLIGDELTIVVDDPTNHPAVEEIAELTGKRIVVGVGLTDEINDALNECYGEGGPTGAASDVTSDWFAPEQLADALADHTGRAFVELLLRTTTERGVQEIHLDPGDVVQLRFRVDGLLQDAGTIGLSWMHLIVRRLRKMMRRLGEREKLQEGFLESSHGGQRLMYHAALVETFAGEAVTLTNLGDPGMYEELATIVGNESQNARLREMLAGGGLVTVLGPDRLETRVIVKELVAEASRAGRKTIHIGDSPFLAEDGYIQMRPDADRAPARNEAIDVAVKLGADVLVLDNLLDAATFARCCREAASGRLVIGTLPFSSLPAAVDFAWEAAENRTLLAEAWRGVVLLATLPEYETGDTEPDEDGADSAAEALSLTAQQRAEADFRRPHAEAKARPQPLVVPIDFGDAIHRALHDGERVEAHTAVGQAANRLWREALTARLLSGCIAWNDAVKLLGRFDHGAA